MNVSALRAATLFAAVVAFPSLASAQYTPSPQEGIFAPLAPCRIYKSVTANNNAPLSANSYFTVNVTGQTSYTNQGGPSSGCGVPASATAVAVSVTTSHATSTGTLNASIPGNTSSTPGTAITFTPSFSQTTGLAIGLSSGSFQVEPVGGATNVTVDVTGYWAPQMAASFNANGTVYSSTSRILSSSHSSTGVYVVTVDRTITACAASVSPYGFDGGITTTQVRNSGSTATVYLFKFASGAFSPVDHEFDLTVIC